MDITIHFSEFCIMQLVCLHTDSNKILYPSMFEFPCVEAPSYFLKSATDNVQSSTLLLDAHNVNY